MTLAFLCRKDLNILISYLFRISMFVIRIFNRLTVFSPDRYNLAGSTIIKSGLISELTDGRGSQKTGDETVLAAARM